MNKFALSYLILFMPASLSAMETVPDIFDAIRANDTYQLSATLAANPSALDSTKELDTFDLAEWIKAMPLKIKGKQVGGDKKKYSDRFTPLLLAVFLAKHTNVQMLLEANEQRNNPAAAKAYLEKELTHRHAPCSSMKKLLGIAVSRGNAAIIQMVAQAGRKHAIDFTETPEPGASLSDFTEIAIDDLEKLAAVLDAGYVPSEATIKKARAHGLPAARLFKERGLQKA